MFTLCYTTFNIYRANKHVEFCINKKFTLPGNQRVFLTCNGMLRSRLLPLGECRSYERRSCEMKIRKHLGQRLPFASYIEYISYSYNYTYTYISKQ